MNRKAFIQISATALLPILLGVFPGAGKRRRPYTVSVISNRGFGHKIREKTNSTPGSKLETDYIIVGGGVAGLAAACTLKDKRFMLFEAGDRLGGSAASGSWESVHFALGAHYELAYPNNYGAGAIELLTRMKIIEFNPISQLHEFVEKKYLIPEEKQEQCYIEGISREDILDGAPGLDELNRVLEEFRGKMPLPTRLIEAGYRYLNELSFKDFLQQKMNLNEDLENRISYQMLDDWGGSCSTVSALAGVHYYMCRPYDEKDVELFSAPQGNSYFIERMVGYLKSPENLFTNSLVASIEETSTGVIAEVLSADGELKTVRAKGLIFAGQKHSLKYVLKNEVALPEVNYAPWVVLNFVCTDGLKFDKWQNDVLTDDVKFLGFVSSIPQHSRSEEYDVVTAYFCFDPGDRRSLVEIEKDPENFVDSTMKLIAENTGVDLAEFTTHVNVNVMGHAMPIPVPGYLTLSDVPKISDRIVLAGVDTGRLPLFMEAFDSGIQAAEYLVNDSNMNSNS